MLRNLKLFIYIYIYIIVVVIKLNQGFTQLFNFRRITNPSSLIPPIIIIITIIFTILLFYFRLVQLRMIIIIFSEIKSFCMTIIFILRYLFIIVLSIYYVIQR